ncbi:unnamed protein product [Paramecium pentaurelia]|uniref:TLDc domain-containing protein n=1 Tax=Paramecium pentaurelia TaxID=43138 RepID=A0A8S1V4I6_9CILI|nr:unnamed protein product [Paramecium pentaurelia]
MINDSVISILLNELNLFSLILTNDDFWLTLFFQKQSKSKKIIQCLNLIYLGTSDGFNADSFLDKVNGRINLLMILKSKCQNIFGGYTSCKQIKNNCGYIQKMTHQYHLCFHKKKIKFTIQNIKLIICFVALNNLWAGIWYQKWK